MRYIIPYFLCLFFISCIAQEKQTYRLSDDQLANVLFDIHFADVMLPSLTEPQQDSVKRIYWDRMEEIYQLTEPEIREEIEKLEGEPEKLKTIMVLVKTMADTIQ